MRKATIKGVRRVGNGDYVVTFCEKDDVFDICYDVALNTKDANVVAAALLAENIEDTEGMQGYINLVDGSHLKFMAELPVYFADKMPTSGQYIITDIVDENDFVVLKIRNHFGCIDVPVSKYNLHLFEKVLGTDIRRYISYNHKLSINANEETKSFFVDVSIAIIASNNFGAALRTA